MFSGTHTVYPKKYAHGFCFTVLCCGYTLTDFPISIRLTSLALWQSNDCPSASKATLMNMDKYFMWIHYERLRNHNKAKHNKTVCIFIGICCTVNVRRSHNFNIAHNIIDSDHYWDTVNVRPPVAKLKIFWRIQLMSSRVGVIQVLSQFSKIASVSWPIKLRIKFTTTINNVCVEFILRILPYYYCTMLSPHRISEFN